MTREAMPVDVVVVGAGPAGLATAIKLGQLAKQAQQTLSICILEKGAEVGAHTISGAVLETRAVDELLPNWRELNAPITTEVTDDEFLYLTKHKAKRLPTPPQMRNHGNYMISLGQVCRWLASQAEALGIEIYPGFAATEILCDDNDTVIGVATGDMGIDKHGAHGEQYQPGMELHARYTVLAEGCRGSLTKQVIAKYALDKYCDPQSYALGIKEIWQVNSPLHQTGKVTHTIGWPLDHKTYGGSFIYHLPDRKIALGLVVGLDYQNPYLSPFNELQRFKHHPAIKPLFADGERLAYGARALNEGGWQAIPQLSFPGGLLVGCSAGFVNVPKIKGNHTAMKSGILAAEEIFKALQQTSHTPTLNNYQHNVQSSWLGQELKQVRNIRPAFHWGLWPGLLYAAIDTYVFRGRAPWTMHSQADYQQLKQSDSVSKIDYPKPDGKISFDRLSSVFLTGTQHNENQPVHLQLINPELAISVNYKHYASPETRYCPAGVYEIIEQQGQPQLQINAANCIHCKTCDIKDPRQNINWVPPEGGGGPNYEAM